MSQKDSLVELRDIYRQVVAETYEGRSIRIRALAAREVIKGTTEGCSGRPAVVPAQRRHPSLRRRRTARSVRDQVGIENVLSVLQTALAPTSLTHRCARSGEFVRNVMQLRRRRFASSAYPYGLDLRPDGGLSGRVRAFIQ